MRICFPIAKDEGLANAVYGHFAASPIFHLEGTESVQAITIAKSDSFHPTARANRKGTYQRKV